jgi:transposase-like protein
MSGDFETGFETERGERTGKAERLDVIPLSNGNRGWTPAAKARIIEESFKQGANVAEVARRNGMLPQQLYNWRGRFPRAGRGDGLCSRSDRRPAGTSRTAAIICATGACSVIVFREPEEWQ